MSAHAKLSASGAHRWMNCPAAPALEEQALAKYGEQTSAYAEEGTQAHEQAAEWLIKGNTPAEPMDRVQEYVDYCNALRDDLDVSLIEQKVHFDHLVPNGFGTADFVAWGKDTLHVVDLKYGQGVPVSAENNPQIRLYALGAVREFSTFVAPSQVTMHIVQPRLGVISTETLPMSELLAWGDTVKAAALHASDPYAAAVPSETACRFCKAKALCPAQHALAVEGFTARKAPEILTLEELGAVLPQMKLIKAWTETVQKFALTQALQGATIAGHKLVHGRSSRAWTQGAAAPLAETLGYDAYKHDLISPAQAEKLLGKGHEILRDHCLVSDGAPTLVAASDKRPAIDTHPAAGFEDVTEAA